MQEYQRLAREYSKAVGNLAAKLLSESEYEQLSAVAEKARHAAQAARRDLNEHIAQHGC